MKKIVIFLLILVFCFISCDYLFDDDNDDDRKGKDVKASEKKVKDIKYTAAPDNNTDTNSIEFTFADEIKTLKAEDIHIKNKSGSVIKGKLSGSGGSWSLEVVTSARGMIEVKIKKHGIEDKIKKVNVYLSASAPENCDCNKCDEEQKCCKQDCGTDIEYDCNSCKDQGCDDCNIIAY